MTRDKLAEEIGDALGISPNMVRLYAARLAIEITIGRPLVKSEWNRVYSAVADSSKPIHEAGVNTRGGRGLNDGIY